MNNWLVAERHHGGIIGRHHVTTGDRDCSSAKIYHCISVFVLPIVNKVAS